MVCSILSWKNILAGQTKRHKDQRIKLEKQLKELEDQLKILSIEEDKDGFLNWQIWEAELDGLKEFDDLTFGGGYEL